jgi:hypothetical protein
MKAAVAAKACEGWRVVSVTPVLRGHHHDSHEELSYGGYGYGWGYSTTAALVVVLERDNPD